MAGLELRRVDRLLTDCLTRSSLLPAQDELRMMRGDDEDFGDLEEDPGQEESDMDDNDLEECVPRTLPRLNSKP